VLEGLDMHEMLGASSEQLLSKEAFLAFEMSFFRAGIRLEGLRNIFVLVALFSCSTVKPSPEPTSK